MEHDLSIKIEQMQVGFVSNNNANVHRVFITRIYMVSIPDILRYKNNNK